MKKNKGVVSPKVMTDNLEPKGIFYTDLTWESFDDDFKEEIDEIIEHYNLPTELTKEQKELVEQLRQLDFNVNFERNHNYFLKWKKDVKVIEKQLGIEEVK